MVAAYMIGYGVTEEYMKENKHLRFAKGETDTGVLISWNTEKPELEESTPIVKEKSLCINPLNWRRDATYAPVNMNLGSLIKGKIVRPGIADAKINVKKGHWNVVLLNRRIIDRCLIYFLLVAITAWTMDFITKI